MTTINSSDSPRPRLKRLAPWALLAVAVFLALSIDAVRRYAGVNVALPASSANAPAANAPAAPIQLKSIAEPLIAAEQPAAGLKKIRSSGGRSAGLKEIPPAEGRLQRTSFGQEVDLVKRIPREEIIAEPLAALEPAVDGARRPRAVNPDPSSVFAWGPWSQTTSVARADGLVEQDTPPQQGFVRTAVVTQARQDSAGSRPAAQGLTPPGGNPPPAFTAPVVIPPLVVTPPLAGDIKPGHGYGDRNHTHQHRRGSSR